MANQKDTISIMLFVAASRGDVDETEKLLSFDPTAVHATNADKFFPLHVAAISNNLPVCVMLLERGANIEALNGSTNETSLHCAAATGRVEICNFLLNNGKVMSPSALMSLTILYSAFTFNHLILCKGANINKVTSLGETALHLAARGGHLTICDLLVKRGINKNYRTRNGNDALFVAAENGMKDICCYLISAGMNMDSKNIWGWTALHASAASGHVTTTSALIRSGSLTSDES